MNTPTTIKRHNNPVVWVLCALVIFIMLDHTEKTKNETLQVEEEQLDGF
jgi:hypothetical protein